MSQILSPLAVRLQAAQQPKPYSSAPRPQQPKLFATKPVPRAVREKPNVLSKTRSYVRQNGEAARIIVADPVRYEGFLTEWAMEFFKNHPEERR